jgi:hypothetical protein
MIDCWGYRLYPGQNDMSAVYVDYVYDGSRKPIVVAPTLNAFFKAYLNDADGLLNQPHGR